MALADGRSAHRSRRTGWATHAAASAGFAVPFLVIGALAATVLYVSNTHAHLVEKALLALDRGRLELIGFVYPPLPFVLLLAWPTPLVASACAALAGGATSWVLWRRLEATGMPVSVRALLVIGVMSAPPVVYLATQSVAEMLAILLLLLAWTSLLTFVGTHETRPVFVAGIMLGIAFFVTYYAVLFALVYAVAAVIAARERGIRAGIATGFVLLFPPLAAALAWCYLNWLFTGDPLLFTRDPASSLFAYWRPSSEDLSLGWVAALQAMTRDLLAAPLYVVVVLALTVASPARVPLLLTPAALVTAVRAAGMVCPATFTVALLSVTAVAGLPASISRRFVPVCIIAALVQIGAGHVIPLSGDAAAWRDALLTGQPSDRDLEEHAVAHELARRPAGTILLDDRTGYRLVARAGTARPFVLPADPLYALAESQPAEFVDYIVVPAAGDAEASDRLARLYARQPPPRLQVITAWARWRLYGRVADMPAPPDLAPNPPREG